MTPDTSNPASPPDTPTHDKAGNAHLLRAVRRKLQDIRPHPLARGLLDTRHVTKLKKDIQDHGQRNPISVARDSDGGLVIEDGHHRFAAMEALGQAEIWVVIRPYPPSDPAVVRELTSQLSRRKSAAERTSLLLRAVSELAAAGRLESMRSDSDASLSGRAALGRALDINENLAGKLLTIAQDGLADLVERFASAPLTTAGLECLYQFAQTPGDVQRAALETLGETVSYATADDVQALRRSLARSTDIAALVRQWAQQTVERLEAEHAGSAGKMVAKIIADVGRISARLPCPARRLFQQQLRQRLSIPPTSELTDSPTVAAGRASPARALPTSGSKLPM